MKEMFRNFTYVFALFLTIPFVYHLFTQKNDFSVAFGIMLLGFLIFKIVKHLK